MKSFTQLLKNENINEKAELNIDVARRIIKDEQHEQGIDLQTANLIIQIYDALSAKNRTGFNTMPLSKLAKLVWKLASK